MRNESSPVKIMVWKGDGPDPGYQWTVLSLDCVFDEAQRHFDDAQYEHLAHQIRDLAGHPSPTRSDTLSIKKVEGFYELRDKGGPLGKGINVRIYFDRIEKGRVIRILGVDVKKNEGHISPAVKMRITRRQRKWDAGEYPVYTEKTTKKAK